MHAIEQRVRIWRRSVATRQLNIEHLKCGTLSCNSCSEPLSRSLGIRSSVLERHNVFIFNPQILHLNEENYFFASFIPSTWLVSSQ